ncbi:MAG TPA: hypothetical protein VL069_13585 [Opitutus sp.]|nr:hypothetical protein [Opitutus sp.]
MDLAAARQQIQSSFARMDALYLRPLFDEWAILSLAAKQGILAYVGPRAETFRKTFPEDIEPLRAMVAGRQFAPGEFEFAQEAGGTRYDACVKIGDTSFLVCNHTTRGMTEIRRDPKWLTAQSAFFELCEKFRANPLVV